MKLVLADASHFKDSISVISELVNEARFKVTKDYVELVAMDPATVAMVIFKLLSSGFTEYHVDNDVELALNLANLKQVLKRAKASDILSLELGEENKLKIELKSNSTRTFFLPLLDIEEKEQRIPPLKFSVNVQTSTDVLANAIEDASIVADSLSFVAHPDRLCFEAVGDLSKVNIEVKPDKETKLTSESTANVRSKYSIEYLKKMILASKLASDVTFSFDQEYPLKLEFKVVDKVLLSFILAPRVDND